MQNLLVISALGQDKPGIVKALSEAVLEHGGNITDSRMAVLGDEFAIIMLVGGGWDAVAKLESALPRLETELGLTITSKRTSSRTPGKESLPYMVEVVSMDHPGIVHDITGFFSEREINIEDLSTSTYSAAHTGTPMFSMVMNVSIPADLSLATLRGDFMDLCDELNVDAVMGPGK